MAANGSVRIDQLVTTNTVSGGDLLIIQKVSTQKTRAITVDNLFMLAGHSGQTFANSTANTAVKQGQLFWDTNYLYVATANGTVKRVALSSF